MKSLFTLALLLASTGAAADAIDGVLEISRLSGNVYVHTSYREFPGHGNFPSNGLIVVHGESATLIDTAWPEEDTPRILAWLKERNITLENAIVTHSHDDRTSGIAYLNAAGVKTYASRRTNALLAARGEPQAVAVFEDGLPASITDRITIHYPGAGHAEDNHVVWLRDEGILFGGCLIKEAGARNLGNIADARVDAWSGAINDVQRKFPEARLIVPGHGAAGGRELLVNTARLVEEYRQRMNGGLSSQSQDPALR